jgi:DNA repair photolyase
MKDSQESTFRESSIQYLKSFLSVNTHVGCNLGCEYCIIRAFNLPSYPKKIASPEEVFNLLTRNLYFSDKTPITINNKTDPLLPSVKESTFGLLKLFNDYNLKNPIVIISKLKYTKEEINLLEGLNLNIYHFTSYSGLGYPIEKVKKTIQEDNIRLLSQTTIKSIHYWRPIIQSVNDEYKILEKMLNFVADKCDASVVSGIRLPAKVVENLRKLGINLTFEEYYSEHKKLDENTKKFILQMAEEECPDYPVFFHTSCVLSYFENEPDYQLNYLKNGLHCNPSCKNRELCINYHPSIDVVKEELSKFTSQYKILTDEKKILVPKNFSLEDLSYLQYRLKMKIVRML